MFGLFKKKTSSKPKPPKIKKMPNWKWEEVRKLYEDGKYQDVIERTSYKEIPSWMFCVIMAHSHFEVGNIERGRKLFRKAFTIPEGDKNDTRRMFGQCEFHAKNYIDAINILQEVEPDFIKDEIKYYERATVPLYLGLSFQNLEKYELAIEAYKRAPLGKRDLFEDLLEINIHVAECYEGINKPKMAIKHYNKALSAKYDPDLDKKIESLKPK